MSAAILRLFVALDLPAEVCSVLAALGSAAAAQDPALRAVPPASLHVTLCFLGACAQGESQAIARAVRETAAPVPSLVLESAVWLPRRRPSVLAVGLTDPLGSLAALQERLTGALTRGGWYASERRPFLPHVTVARVRRGASPRRALPPRPTPAGSFAGAAVALYVARLHPSGARYEALERVTLR